MRTETQELSLEELRGLYELVRSLHGAQGLEGIVTGFLEKLNDVVPFDSCAIIFGDDKLAPAATDGDDELIGGGGADTVTGGAGNDIIFGDDKLAPAATDGDDHSARRAGVGEVA